MDSKKAGIATALVMAILSAGYIASIFIKKDGVSLCQIIAYCLAGFEFYHIAESTYKWFSK